ncbi:natural killer cell receptor 2B4 [Psammomys obesus]|uniref:natural killer cell receptor 2B4 n=1 Tax=Psammomys obesus TaxID=48139 RepID=UPI00245340F8|nr:natural killer cell receptor 2B4 [Psammomys obesus]
MLGRIVLLVLFLLLRGHQIEGCSDSYEDLDGVSGKDLCLRPTDIQTKNVSARWKKKQLDSNEITEIVDLSPPQTKSIKIPSIYDFEDRDFALVIKSAKPENSGLYWLEITDSSGTTCCKNFQISIFDHVEKPYLKGEWTTWASGTCQLSLYCLVPKDDNVNYTLYRGSTLISRQRNGTHLESQADASGLQTYTCNVSNKVSWAIVTLNITQGCQSVDPKFIFLPFVVIIVILAALFLGAIICFCVWDKKRKQSQFVPKEDLTIYEYIKDPQVMRDQLGHSRASGSSAAVQEDETGQREGDGCLFQEQMLEQKSPGNGGTIYSMIQYKPHDSTSQEKVSIYSEIQPSRKSGSKKRNQNPSSNYTVYEEVGKQSLKAHNPTRLSRRELENFDVYF